MSAILPLQNPPRFRGGFETIATPMLGRNGQPLTESEWRGGVTGQTLPEATIFTNYMLGGDWGDPDDGDTKPVSPNGDEVGFKPAGVGTMFECQMNGENTERGDSSTQQVRNELGRLLWSLIALHIQSVGTTIDCPDQPGTNPTLQGVAQLPSGHDDDTPGNIEGVLQGLLDSSCWHADDPVFIVPRAWLPQFVRRGLVRWSDSDGAFLLNGIHRIAFDCIANVGPAGTTTAGDGSEVWIYALPAPQVAVSDEADITSARAHLRNLYTVRGEHQFGYWFDTSRIFAAKATVL